MIDRLEKFLKARLAIEFQLMQEENRRLQYEKYRADLRGDCPSRAKIEQRNDEYFRMNSRRRDVIQNQDGLFRHSSVG